jgi:hypothetical protein
MPAGSQSHHSMRVVRILVSMCVADYRGDMRSAASSRTTVPLR